VAGELRVALKQMLAHEPATRFSRPATAREALAATPEAMPAPEAEPVP
jgi:hypothetical protein